MATFTSFSDILPDPHNPISPAGSKDPAGLKGPGFASMRLERNQEITNSRTISGRGIHRSTGTHFWSININYNPMLREEFDVVDSFLASRKSGSVKPFYVILPQNNKPRDPAFATFATNNVIRAKGANSEGVSKMMIDSAINILGNPSIGDLFNVNDPNDVNHLKTYKVTAVETNSLYQEGQTQPGLNERRIHFEPALTKFVADDATIVWINPKIRVIQKGDIQGYDLNTDNLYQFNFQVEEALP